MPYHSVMPPTITPLRAPLSGHTSTHIDEGTYIELETETPYAVVYFTTDGSKPNPFTKSLGGVEQTFRYKAPFTLKPGKRCIKAIAVSRNGIQESRVVTKSFVVESLDPKSKKHYYLEDGSTINDILDDDESGSSDAGSEEEKPKKDKKSKNDKKGKNDKKEKKKSDKKAERDDMLVEDLDRPELKGTTSFHPANHSGTQINLWGGPPNMFPGNFDVRGPNATGSSFGMGLPQMHAPQPVPAVTQSVDRQQLEYLASQLTQKIDQTRQMTLSDVRTLVKDLESKTLEAVEKKPPPPPPPAPIIQSFEPELNSASTGGDLKKQLQHVYAQLLDLGKRDAEFRDAMSVPLGKVFSATLDDNDDGFTLTVQLGKPGQSTKPKPKPKAAKQPSKPPTPKEPFDTGVKKLEAAKPVEQVNPVAAGPKIETETELKASPEDTGPALQLKTEADVKPKEQVESSFFETEEYVQQGTHKPASEFNVDDDCQRLNKAVRGLGTDEDTVCNILSKRSISQRVQIAERYKLMFGKEFAKEFSEELKPSGEFKKMVTALLLRPEDYDATELRNAMKGLGSDEMALIGIICTRTQEQMKMIREAYQRLFPTRQLDKDIESETSGELKRILFSLLQATRPDSKQFDRTVAKEDARKLYDAGVGDKSGTNTDVFNMILATRSNAHLRAVFEEYEKISSVSMIESLKKEMSGDTLQAYLAVVRCIQNKPRYFAYALYKAMKGLGTKDEVLIRIVISRCEIDMVQIKEQFLALEDNTKQETLGQWISDDTRGLYRQCLLTLVGEEALLKKKK